MVCWICPAGVNRGWLSLQQDFTKTKTDTVIIYPNARGEFIIDFTFRNYPNVILLMLYVECDITGSLWHLDLPDSVFPPCRSLSGFGDFDWTEYHIQWPLLLWLFPGICFCLIGLQIFRCHDQSFALWKKWDYERSGGFCCHCAWGLVGIDIRNS